MTLAFAPARLQIRLPRLNYDRLALLGAVTVGIIVGIAQATGSIADPFDAHFYWSAPVDHLYPAVWGPAGGYVYPPPLALIMGLFHPIGWPLFVVGWTTACWAGLWYCARGFTPLVLLASLALVPFIGGNVIGYLFMGNVQILLAAAVVAAVRHPAASALPLLTKGIGVSFVWYAVRREWRNLAIALATSLIIVGVTMVLAPTAWLDFFTFITRNTLADSAIPIVPIPFAARFVAAIALTAWGARTNRSWTLPVAASIASPALYWWSWLPIWVGVLALRRKA